MQQYDQRINAGRFDETIVGWEKPKMGESMKNFGNAITLMRSVANLWFGGDIEAAFKAISSVCGYTATYLRAIANRWFHGSIRKTINAIKRRMK